MKKVFKIADIIRNYSRLGRGTSSLRVWRDFWIVWRYF